VNSKAKDEQHVTTDVAIMVPLDGYHYTRAKLDTFPNKAEAHARRGARWTFDAEGFVDLVKRVRDQKVLTSTTKDCDGSGDVLAPSFSHAKKDPVFDDITILPNHRIVVFDGLYLTLDIPPWNEPLEKKLYDEVWFVDVDREMARERLAKRHVAAGITSSLEEGRTRAKDNDEVNGDEILENLNESMLTERMSSTYDLKWESNDGG
jgi:pantothenate kinase